MYIWEGKHFSIIDPNNVSTVVYQINETLKEEDLKNSPKYTVTRLDFTEEIYGDKKRKLFMLISHQKIKIILLYYHLVKIE